MRKKFFLTTRLGMVALGMSAGCGGDSNPPVDQTAVNEYIGALPPWMQPPPDSETTMSIGVVEREKMTPAGAVRFSCQQTKHDVLQSYTSILSLGSSQTNLKPGMLLQGNSYRAGTLQSIPLPRSPATLSIDLAVPTPTVTVDSPDSASLQQGVSTLQIEASSQLTNLPALVAFTKEESSSENEMTLQIGASLAYSSAVASLDFEAAFANQETVQKHTVVAKLMQPMYTISFADDQIAEPAKFFADTVTAEDLKTQETLGTIGPDNLPVFISSVTYGRMVVFTATSTTASSATDISAKLQASFNAYSGSGTLTQADKDFLSSLQIKVLAIGGDSAAVGNAIVTGDYNSLFGNADATTAVPLKFGVKNLAGTRPPAGIGDALSFVEENCTPITAQGWVEVPATAGAPIFKQVSVGKGGAVWAVADAGASVYRFDAATSKMVLVDSGLTGNNKILEVAVNDNGESWALRADGSIQQHNVGSAGFITNAAIEMGKFHHFDIAGNQLIGTGLNDEFYRYTATNIWQNLNPNMGSGSSISMADATLAWFRSGNSVTPGTPTFTISTAGAQTMRTSTPAVYPAAASTSEVWGLDTAFAIRHYNFGTSAWDLDTAHPLPGAPVTVSSLDAGPSGNLWIVTGQGKLMHWVP